MAAHPAGCCLCRYGRCTHALPVPAGLQNYPTTIEQTASQKATRAKPRCAQLSSPPPHMIRLGPNEPRTLAHMNLIIHSPITHAHHTFMNIQPPPRKPHLGLQHQNRPVNLQTSPPCHTPWPTLLIYYTFKASHRHKPLLPGPVASNSSPPAAAPHPTRCPLPGRLAGSHSQTS